LSFLNDLITGINTRAPEIRIITTRGPSMRGVEVRITKQSAAQNRVRMTHWVLVSGFLMVFKQVGFINKKAENKE
jgi:hypothetical protein